MSDAKPTTEVEFAGHKVQVPAGGYYDRYRGNPDLDEVARDPAVGNVDFFRRIPKQHVDTRAGKVWTPNYYYRVSTLQLLMAAPSAQLAALLPDPLQALTPLPGRGLVALTFFSYHVCDNDPYNEVSIAVVLREPGRTFDLSAVQLARDIRQRSFYAHVLALPVDTEIARVRGVFGYELPKWLAKIELSIGETIDARIYSEDGSVDLAVSAPAPPLKQIEPQTQITTNTSIGLLDGAWNQTVVQSNPLLAGQVMFPRNVTLQRGGGPMSQLLDGTGAQRIIRMDVVKDTQMVLHMPRPLPALYEG